MPELFLYGIVPMIISYYIQTLCFAPKKKVVSVLPIVCVMAIISVVVVEYIRYEQGHENFLFYDPGNAFLYPLAVLILSGILIIAMIAGVALAWIVYLIKEISKKKTYEEKDI